VEKASQLIDKIYSAALAPSGWPTVLQSLQSLFGATAAGIYTLDTAKTSAMRFELRGVDESYVNSYINHYLFDNPWVEVPELQGAGMIRTDQSLDEYYNSPGFYRKSDYFNEWLKPQGFYYSLGTNLLSHDFVNTKFYMYRPEQAGGFCRRDIVRFRQLSRHMMNAMEVTRRLALKDSQISEALSFIDRLKFGVIFLDERLNIVQANCFAEGLIRTADGLHVKAGTIGATHRTDGKKLLEVIQSALEVNRGKSEDISCTASIRRPSGKRPFCVIAIPLPHRPNLFLASSSAVVLFISDPEQEPIVAIECLRHRYGLTATEAKLAQYLTRGDALREAAEQAGLSYETARWYLKIIFQKTCTRRQPELVRLLLSDQVFVVQ